MVGIGFSFGDIVSGIDLIKDLIRALEDSTGSSAEYRQLVSELRYLKKALKDISKLDLDASLEADKSALMQAGFLCEELIDSFVKKNAKYNNAFTANGDISKWRTNWRKLKWAVDKKAEVDKFRAAIMGHTQTLQAQLTIIQLQGTTLEAKKADAHRHATEQSLEQMAQQTSKDIRLIMQKQESNLQVFEQQNQMLQTEMQKHFQQATDAFNIIVSLKSFFQSLPPQVLLDQPAVLWDAHDRPTKVYLGFVNCWEVSFNLVLWLQL